MFNQAPLRLGRHTGKKTFIQDFDRLLYMYRKNIWLQCPVRTLDLNNRKASIAFDTDWYNMFNFNQYNIISISLPNPVLYENR